jgi:FdhD protein
VSEVDDPRWRRVELANRAEDEVAVEEPLELRVEGIAAAITMRTPGDDLDLAAGFLWTEGVIDGADDLKALAVVAENTVDARLAEGVPPARARSSDRQLYAASSCGVCGKASLERLSRTLGPVPGWVPTEAVLSALPGALAAHQEGFRRTGGLHAAALFSADGTIVCAREDVGRHNAVDKVLGARLRADAGVDGLGLLVSSRASFEIVQKAWSAGIGCVAAVGAPSTLAIETARAAGIALLAWVREGGAVSVVGPRAGGAPPSRD